MASQRQNVRKKFNFIQQCLSNWVTYPLGFNLKIFARTFMSADFVQSTKSTGKEGKAWRSNWVHWEGPRPKNSDHHRNLHNIYFLPTSNIVEISNCKKQGNLDFAIIPSNMVRSWFCKNIYFDKYCFLFFISYSSRWLLSLQGEKTKGQVKKAMEADLKEVDMNRRR